MVVIHRAHGNSLALRLLLALVLAISPLWSLAVPDAAEPDGTTAAMPCHGGGHGAADLTAATPAPGQGCAHCDEGARAPLCECGCQAAATALFDTVAARVKAVSNGTHRRGLRAGALPDSPDERRYRPPIFPG